MQALFSVVVITKNAAPNLATCLASCGSAAEIIVVDSGSQDNTVELAINAGARVIHQAWLGFGLQKQFAVKQAEHNWVLCLDADEWLSNELSLNINKVLIAPKFFAYRFARSNKFMGRFLRHGEGYPDLSLRLFDRRYAHWSDDAVHEMVVSTTEVGTISGDLMHESAEDIASYLSKQNRYTSLQAQILYRRGKQVSTFKLVLSPMLRFLKFYLFKQGWRDGVPGLVHIVIGCINSFVKYAKLRELHRLAVND